MSKPIFQFMVHQCFTACYKLNPCLFLFKHRHLQASSLNDALHQIAVTLTELYFLYIVTGLKKDSLLHNNFPDLRVTPPHGPPGPPGPTGQFIFIIYFLFKVFFTIGHLFHG